MKRHRSARDDHPFSLPFLLFHPPILEPDLHLSVIEAQGFGDLHAPGPGKVLVEVELFLQLRELLGAEIGPDGTGRAGRSIGGELACYGVRRELNC